MTVLRSAALVSGAERRGSRVLAVGDDRAACIDPVGGHAGFGQRGGDDARAEKLAHRRDDVERARRDFAKDGERTDDVGELIELTGDVREQRRSAPDPMTSARTADACRSRSVVHRGSASPGRPAPAVDAIASSASVTLLIADTTTTGPRPSRVRADPDDLDQTSDSFWIGDRRAAEFLNDHGVWLVD